jgi:hypothetical protein
MAGDEQATRGSVRDLYLNRSPVLVLTLTSAAALAGGLLLLGATLWSFPALGLAGVVIATIAAWVTTDYTAARWRKNPPGWRIFVCVAAVAGAVLVVIGEVVRAPTIAFIGLMALTVGIGPLVGEIRDDAETGAEWWMQAGLATGLVSAIVVSSDVSGWLRLAACVGLIVGFGLFTGGLSTMCAEDRVPAAWVLRIVPGDARQRGLIVAGTGLVVAFAGLVVGQSQVAAVGAWLTVVAMIMLSVRPARFGMSTLMKRSVLVAGVAMVSIGGYQLYVSGIAGRSEWFVVFVVLTVALAGGWIVWRGATLFIVVVLGFVLCWGLFAHTVSDPNHISTVADDDPVAAQVVAFGDSFISGEGAPEFFEGTDQRGDERNECRRAPTAYPALIADDDSLDFLACSGAKLRDVLDLAVDDAANDPENQEAISDAIEQMDDDADETMISDAEMSAIEASTMEAGTDDRRSQLPCTVPDEVSLGQYPCGPDGVYGSRLQIDHLPADRSATELVLLSIGGNDVRFGDIVAGCLLPGSCAERREVWLDNVSALGPELTEGYRRIKAAFGGDVPIVVMPYPLVLTEDTCDDSPLEVSEHEFIFEFTTVLNRQIESSAAQAGVHYFAPGAFSLSGNRICESPDRALNLIQLQPSDGPVTERMKPGSWTHNSMHPNERGHQMIAAALDSWLTEQDIVGSGNPAPVDASAAPLLDVRVARPYPVAPNVIEQLRSSGTSGAAAGDCDFGQIDSFATRVAIFDEQPSDGSRAEAFRVPVTGADTTATICVTDSAGTWLALTPVETRRDESVSRLPSAEPIAEIRDGTIFVSGGRPERSCPPERDEHLCSLQWILFTTPNESTTEGDPSADRSWSLRAVQYCTLDDDCEDTFSEWRTDQISQAGRRVGATIGVIFVGGWLLALGIELVNAGRIQSRIRPRFTATPDSDAASPA